MLVNVKASRLNAAGKIRLRLLGPYVVSRRGEPIIRCRLSARITRIIISRTVIAEVFWRRARNLFVLPEAHAFIVYDTLVVVSTIIQPRTVSKSLNTFRIEAITRCSALFFTISIISLTSDGDPRNGISTLTRPQFPTSEPRCFSIDYHLVFDVEPYRM